MLVVLYWCGVGLTVLGHGDTHEQIEALTDVLKQNPDHVASLLERADLYRRHRQFNEALIDLDRVRLLSPTNNAAYYLTGLTLLEQGEFNKAETVLQDFLSRSPRSPRGQLALARVFTHQQRHLNAAQAYELAVDYQVTPSPDLYLARAQAYMNAGEAYLAQALEGLEEGITLIGPLITFRRLAIAIEIEQGKFHNALVRVNGILQDVDRKETWLVKKAQILTAMGRNEEAHQQFLLAERAIERLPERPRTSPAIRTLRQTIHANLNRKTREKDVQHEP